VFPNYLGISQEELQKMGAIHTAKEIVCQPELWTKVFDVIEKNYKEIKFFLKEIYIQKDLQIILTGAGSSAFLGDVLEGVFQKYVGIKTSAIATTDLVTHPDYYLRCNGSLLLISFARSGNSPESVKAVELSDIFCKNIYHFIITCNPEGELVKNASKENTFILYMPPDADDKSLAMTGSFTAMLLSGLLIARIDELNELDAQVHSLCEYGRNIITKYTQDLKVVSELDFKRAIFLGSGIFRGAARESHLKLQELTDGNVICKYDSFLGFRHGPKAVINEDTLIVYLFSNNDYVLKYEKDLVRAVNQGRKALCSIGVMENNIEDIDFDLRIPLSCNSSRIDETFLTIASVLPAQILGFFKSLALGLKPDTPSESGMITRVVQGVNIYPYEK
jgi:tagatose-6-phosphate ketose/aldose isomerase